MSSTKHPDLNRNLPLRIRFRILRRKVFPAFHLGWMLLYSLFFAAVIFFAMEGLDRLSSALIKAFGYAALTNANFSYFFRSWQGYVFVFVFLICLGFIGAILMNGIIFVSDDMLHGRRIRLPRILRRSVRSIRLFLCPEAVPIILYYFVFILFFTISLLSIIPNPFEIPGYFRYLISKKLLSLILYFAAFVLISIPLLRNPLLLHDILLNQESPSRAQARTRAYSKACRRILTLELLSSVLGFCAVLIAGTCCFLYFPLLIQTVFAFLPQMPRRVLVLLATYTGLAILALAVLLAIWILPVKLSLLHHYMTSDSKPLPAARPRRKSFQWIFIPALLALLVFAVVVSYLQFNYLFPPAKNIEAVVHRLGGDLDTENTLEGMELAMELGAPAMETDIQRTKDGEYVIFHDSTLKRMCGLPYRINEMTLEEVKAVDLKGPGLETRKIPTLSEVLDKANGRVRLYLELKGVDADAKMARDVAQMVRERSMEDDCVLISLNYNLVNYISHRIPDLQCGYLYFFAYGSPASLSGQILLAQSNAISIQRTRSIHSKGKKIYCWTVNSQKTAQNMVRQRVDGIIADRYDIIASVLDHMQSRNDYERIMDVLLR